MLKLKPAHQPIVSARELVDLEARTRAALSAIRSLPKGKVRTQALAEAVSLQARAQTLRKIAAGSSLNVVGP